MRFPLLSAVAFLPALVRAATWHTVEWDAPKFTALSGDFVIPKLPTPGGTPYVWPALQSSNGVLQAVCDGRNGAWWIGDGFYGTPSLPWGAGFSVKPGDVVHFTFSSSGSNGETWTATLSGPGSATSTFQITGSTMNRAILAVELTNVTFDFGPVIFKNLVITATTAASGWCGKTVSLGYSAGPLTSALPKSTRPTCSSTLSLAAPYYTRYFARNINVSGHVSNFKETEKLVIFTSYLELTFPSPDVLPRIQICGIVPLFLPEINTLRYRLDLQVVAQPNTPPVPTRRTPKSNYDDIVLVNVGCEMPIKGAFGGQSKR